MPSYVFRFREDGGGELLYFDGINLARVRMPVDLESLQPRSVTWGPGGERNALCALLLACHCGVPEDLQAAVAQELERCWVRKLDPVELNVPQWIVMQEVVRIAMRVMNDAAGK